MIFRLIRETYKRRTPKSVTMFWHDYFIYISLPCFYHCININTNLKRTRMVISTVEMKHINILFKEKRFRNWLSSFWSLYLRDLIHIYVVVFFFRVVASKCFSLLLWYSLDNKLLLYFSFILLLLLWRYKFWVTMTLLFFLFFYKYKSLFFVRVFLETILFSLF